MHGTSDKRNKVLVLLKATEPVFRTFRSEVLFIVFCNHSANCNLALSGHEHEKILTHFDMASLFF